MPKTKKEVLDKNIFSRGWRRRMPMDIFYCIVYFISAAKSIERKDFFCLAYYDLTLCLKDGKDEIKNIVPRLDNDEEEDRQGRIVDMNLFDTEEISNKLLIVFRDKIKANESLLEGNYGKRRAGA